MNLPKSLIINFMGSQLTKFGEKKYSYYSTQTHPLQGVVDVYQIQGESAFVMRKINWQSDDIVSIAKNIEQYRCPYLCRYFGSESPSNAVMCNDIIKNVSVVTFWEYLNYDLERDLKYNKKEWQDEQKIWLILHSCVEGLKITMSQGIFMEFNYNIIQFCPQMTVKIYWGNLQTTNNHRSYFKFFNEDNLVQALYAPQELASIQSQNQNRKLNLEKASIYSLGILLLAYTQNMRAQNFYDYENLEIRGKEVQNAFKKAMSKFSYQLLQIISRMIQIDANKRIGLQQLVYCLKFRPVDSQKIIKKRNSEHHKSSKENVKLQQKFSLRV